MEKAKKTLSWGDEDSEGNSLLGGGASSTATGTSHSPALTFGAMDKGMTTIYENAPTQPSMDHHAQPKDRPADLQPVPASGQHWPGTSIKIACPVSRYNRSRMLACMVLGDSWQILSPSSSCCVLLPLIHECRHAEAM